MTGKPVVDTPEQCDSQTTGLIRTCPPIRLTTVALLIVLVALAAFLRFRQLGAKSYHLDEVITVTLVNPEAPPIREILRATRQNINDVPGEQMFHYFIGKWWNSESGHRFPAALFGSLTVVLIYLWAASVWGRLAGLAAAVLLAFSVWHIGSSRDAAKAYYMLYLFTIAMGWAHRTAALRGGTGRWVLFSAITALGLMFHLFVLIPLAVCGCCALLDIGFRWREKSRKEALRYAMAFAAACFVALLPFALFYFTTGITSDSTRYAPLPIDATRIWRILSAATGSSASETGSLSARTVVVLLFAGLGLLSLATARQRRRELGLLLTLLLLALYMYQSLQGAKYFATRHTAFLHPYLLFLAAGGMAWTAGWIRKQPGRLTKSPNAGEAAKIAVAAGMFGFLVLTNVDALRRYYVYGVAYQYLPYRSIVLFLKKNVQPDERLFAVGGTYWFLKAYAPDLAFTRPTASDPDSSVERREPYWYLGPHTRFSRETYSQLKFNVPGWELGYCSPEAGFDAPRFAARLKPSGVHYIDRILLNVVENKNSLLDRVLALVPEIQDRRQKAQLLSMCARHLRETAGLPPWKRSLAVRLSAEAVAANPFDHHVLNYAAYDALAAERYDLAARWAKRAIAGGGAFWPTAALRIAAERTSGSVCSRREFLKHIDLAVRNAGAPELASERERLLKMRSKVVSNE